MSVSNIPDHSRRFSFSHHVINYIPDRACVVVVEGVCELGLGKEGVGQVGVQGCE